MQPNYTNRIATQLNPICKISPEPRSQSFFVSSTLDGFLDVSLIFFYKHLPYYGYLYEAELYNKFCMQFDKKYVSCVFNFWIQDKINQIQIRSPIKQKLYLDPTFKIKKNRFEIGKNQIRPDQAMVFILDGCSFDYAHTWSKSDFPTCCKHLVTSKESSNPGNYLISYVRNMFCLSVCLFSASLSIFFHIAKVLPDY